jgi:hypothetical protein
LSGKGDILANVFGSSIDTVKKGIESMAWYG